MTITRPTPKSLTRLARPALLTSFDASTIFFQPSADRVARHAEGAGQAAQAAALVVGAQNGGFFFVAVAQGLRVLAAAPSAIIAQKALLAIASFAIADKIFALAVIAFLFDHGKEFIFPPPFEPLPLRERFFNCLIEDFVIFPQSLFIIPLRYGR